MHIEAVLAHFPKMTPAKFKDITRAFDSPRSFFESDRHTLTKRLAWKEDLIDTFILWRDEVDETRIEKILKQEDITVLIQEDQEYPSLLKEIYDPPFLYFCKRKSKSNKRIPTSRCRNTKIYALRKTNYSRNSARPCDTWSYNC